MVTINKIIYVFFSLPFYLCAQDSAISIKIKENKINFGDSITIEIHNQTNKDIVLYLDPNQISANMKEKADSSTYANRIDQDKKFLSLGLALYYDNKGENIVEYSTIFSFSSHDKYNYGYGDEYIYYIDDYIVSKKKIVPANSKLDIVVPFLFSEKFKPKLNINPQNKYWMRLIYNGGLIQYLCKYKLEQDRPCESNTVYDNIQSNMIEFKL